MGMAMVMVDDQLVDTMAFVWWVAECGVGASVLTCCCLCDQPNLLAAGWWRCLAVSISTACTVLVAPLLVPPPLAFLPGVRASQPPSPHNPLCTRHTRDLQMEQ